MARLLSRSIPRDAAPLDAGTQDRVTATRPMWLVQGIAEYFGKSAAQSAGVVDGDPFDSGGLEGMDRTCVQRSASSDRAQVLPFIGERGAPAALFTTERPKFAPIFYPCAFSFTKHVSASGNFVSSTRPWPSGVRIIAMSDRTSSSPMSGPPSVPRLAPRPPAPDRVP